MKDIMFVNDNQSYQQQHNNHNHDVVEETVNENNIEPSSLLSSSVGQLVGGIDESHNTNHFPFNTNNDTVQTSFVNLRSDDHTTAATNTIFDNTSNNGGDTTHDPYHYNTAFTSSSNNDYEEEFTTVSMSPDERNTCYPSSSSSRRTAFQPQHYNNQSSRIDDIQDDDQQLHLANTRPSRESVLQRLCEALLRRSLTKIDLSQRGLIPSDARLVKMALLQNQQLTILKLGYNNLGDYGAAMLADGINSNVLNLLSLDLGFNNIGDVGCTALCHAISPRLHTLYLAGNSIGEDGAVAIADLVQKRGSCLRKLYLTGNLLGPDGVKAITESILATENRQLNEDTSSITDNNDNTNQIEATSTNSGTSTANDTISSYGSVEELYLGGSGMGAAGCHYVAQLLERSQRIRVISLPNCEINDESIIQIATSIKVNRKRLPLQSLQLSFNRITCKGVEYLANSVWGSLTMKELLLDNNEIADRGAQHIAAVLLPHVKTLESLNIGFNLIKAPGIQIVMKAVVDTNCTLRSLSISGNTIDTTAAKAISYALAYNRTLQSLSLVHCNIGHEEQRHISAGVVSNSRSGLREVSGFDLGPVIATLGFPAELESWSNDKILFFLYKMWNHHRSSRLSSIDGSMEDDHLAPDEDDTLTDPLNFLVGPLPARTAPEDATIVVEVAKKAFAQLGEHGLEGYSQKRGGNDRRSRDSPLSNDNVLLVSSLQPPLNKNRNVSMLPANKTASFIASPEAPKEVLPDPARKTRIADWLSANMKEITKLSQLPFSSAELWRLHQHYFSPVVNESGGKSVAPSPSPSIATAELTSSSVPEVSRPNSTENPCATIMDSFDGGISAMSQPAITATGGNQMASLPILKRKVSYRFLSEAATCSSQCGIDSRIINTIASTPQTVSLLIGSGPVGHTMPPTTKRARRNRARITFLPRTKAKVDSYLDVSHDKALITMRQLYYVELAILSGQVNPLDATENGVQRIHLCGELANDAEMIIVDMI